VGRFGRTTERSSFLPTRVRDSVRRGSNKFSIVVQQLSERLRIHIAAFKFDDGRLPQIVESAKVGCGSTAVSPLCGARVR
jgi:hypothetical protein